MTNQNINTNSVNQQTNIANVENLNIIPKTRWQKRFQELKSQVENNDKYATFIDDFKEYNTIKDGIGLEQKLIDGNFNEAEINRALRFKEKYSKRIVKGEMFLAQQKIDVEIFSIIDNGFYTYVYPLILENYPKKYILEILNEKVIQPILEILNKEGAEDDYLNYNVNDIFGMIYFLTGKCFINWKNYDTI
ncbi:MAG: hypothetical protein Q3983_10395 [Capnocytophaga sp.]|nr:hypothetical protein [Capnocytophaga sp.]